ncbi:protein scribble homolog [Rhopilema esculentum]|uniref:protein scribble homolog n=1 Tax=Rhopilema esculentum TaxID=499914 RepID=UPI0031CE21AF
MFKCLNLFPWRTTRQYECIDRRHSNLTSVPDDVLRQERSLEELYLSANQLRELPKQLFRLYKLKKLAVDDNEIANLPSEIGNLTNLEELDISKNDVGLLPENIQYCKKLTSIDISSNPLALLPDSLTQLKELQSLCMNDMSLNRIPPDIGSLSNLVVLEIRENIIKFLPESFSFLTSLERLDLGSNEIEELPESIGYLSKLVELWLDANFLVTLPSEIGQLKSLQWLDLSDNKLEELPDEISGLTALTDLILSQNNLHELPDGIGKLKKLSILKADVNDLDELTPAIGGLSSLTELILTDNSLDGLPSAIGKLHKLNHMNIDKNRLVTLPAEIGSCTRLSVLSARNNDITKLPKQIGNCRNLTVLDLSGNRLPNLPITVSGLPLKALWLSSNQSQSILKLQVEELEDSEEQVLTCFLLPQLQMKAESLEQFLNEAYENPEERMWSSPRPMSVQFEEIDDHGESNLQRQLTPFPKDLKARHPKKMLQKTRSSSFEDSEKEDQHPPRDKSHHSTDSKHHEVGVRFSQEPSANVNHFQNHEHKHEDQSEESGKEAVCEEDEDEDNGTRGFVSFDLASVEEKSDNTGFLLKRKDTPHFTKGKRIVQSDEQKAREILANLGAKEESEDENSDGQSSSEQEESAGPSTVKFAVPDKEEEASVGRRRIVQTRFNAEVIQIDANPEEEEMDSQCKLARRDTPRPADMKNRMNLRTAAVNAFIEEEEEENEENSHDDVKDLSGEQKTITKVYEEISTVIIRDEQSLGINIAGGKGTAPYKDDEEGIFISKISEGGPADQEGILQIGDKIVKVNEVDVSEMSHYEAVMTLKNAGKEVTLIVLREITDEDAIQTALQAQREEKNVRFAPEPEMEEIEVATETLTVDLKRDGRGLGFSIAGGFGSTPFKGSDPGIFISKIAENGPAAADGRLRVGDKVLMINEQDVQECRHEDAVAILTSSGDTVTMMIYRERIINKRMTPLSKLNGTAPNHTGKYFMQETVSKAEATKAETIPNHNRDENGPISDAAADKKILTEEIILKKGIGPLGLSIVGGSDHASHPFGVDEPGVFVSKIVPGGAASKTNLKVGDRILAVNDINMRDATHHTAVSALIANVPQIKLLVRHDRPPQGLQEIQIIKKPGEKLGISIRGGAKSHPGNPFDKSDEGIFISKVNASGAAGKDGKLKVGVRLLEVNGQSMLGATHVEAVRALRNTGDKLHLLVCDGYDADAASNSLSSVIANPLVTSDMTKTHFQTSCESISSIDRETSTDEEAGSRSSWGKENLDQIEALRNARISETQFLENELELKERELLKKSEKAFQMSGKLTSSLEQNNKSTENHDRSLEKIENGSERQENTRQPTAAELRAIEAEKKAVSRQARMKALEEDAMKAQVVIAQVKALSSSSLEGSSVSDTDRPLENSLFS